MKLMTQLLKNKLAQKGCILAAAALLTPALSAGTPSAKGPAVIAPVEEEPFVTGNVSFIVDTHFISYGADVWGGGSNWDDVLFHPSLELVFNLGGGFSAILGTWWDVNDKVADAEIGGKVQEVDVWAGISYKSGDLTYTLLYQEWMYASGSERIVDLKVAYSGMFLNPSLTIHGRVDDDHGLKTGVVPVLGIAPSVEAGPVTVSFPVNAAFATDEYHGGDGGFAYASAGVTASIPIIEHVNLSLGVTYYYTNDSVIPNNPSDSFLTGSAGIVITF